MIQGAYSIDYLLPQPGILWPAWLMMNHPENLSKKSISTFVQLFLFYNSQNQQINVTLYKELCSSFVPEIGYKIQMGGDFH